MEQFFVEEVFTRSEPKSPLITLYMILLKNHTSREGNVTVKMVDLFNIDGFKK